MIQTPSAECSARTAAGTVATARQRGRGKSAGATARTISQSAVEAPACGCPSRSQLQASRAAGPAQRAAVLAIRGLSQRRSTELGSEVVAAADHRDGDAARL